MHIFGLFVTFRAFFFAYCTIFFNFQLKISFSIFPFRLYDRCLLVQMTTRNIFHWLLSCFFYLICSLCVRFCNLDKWVGVNALLPGCPPLFFTKFAKICKIADICRFCCCFNVLFLFLLRNDFDLENSTSWTIFLPEVIKMQPTWNSKKNLEEVNILSSPPSKNVYAPDNSDPGEICGVHI